MDTVKCTRCGQKFDATENGCPACGHLQKPVPCALHADRSASGQCVICGTPVCAECDRGGSHHACADHCDIPLYAGWAQVYSTGNDMEADLLRENLRSEGIDAEVFSQRDQTFKMDLGEMAQVRLLVPAFEYLAAMDVIRSHMDEQGEVVFACESCGEAYEPGQPRCAACQAALPRSIGSA
jgi:hypothetical protein